MFHVSSQEEFGLRFLLRLAKAYPLEVQLANIAEAEAVSLAYVRKIFGILRHSQLVKASRGVNGGYALMNSPDAVNLREVFQALSSREGEFNCAAFAGNQELCVHIQNCGVRPLIAVLERKLYNFLSELSLAQIAQEEQAVWYNLNHLANKHHNSNADITRQQGLIPATVS